MSSPQYLGCYRDSGNRALPHRYGNKTINECATEAKSKGYQYFGMQYPNGNPTQAECWMGNSGYNKYGKRSDNECAKGSDGRRLGAGWRNAVYKTPTDSTLRRGTTGGTIVNSEPKCWLKIDNGSWSEYSNRSKDQCLRFIQPQYITHPQRNQIYYGKLNPNQHNNGNVCNYETPNDDCLFANCGGQTGKAYQKCSDYTGGDKIRTVNCATESCDAPIDCIMSDWENLGTCSTGGTDCGPGKQYQTRRPIRYAANGGAPCGPTDQFAECDLGRSPCGQTPSPIDCEVGNYGDWSACSKTCGTGSRSRTKPIIRQAANGGTPCPSQASLTQTQACNTNACSTGGTTGAGHKYLGCYMDVGHSGRTYQNKQQEGTTYRALSRGMGAKTIAECAAAAKQNNMKYFGMQYPQGYGNNRAECYVGNDGYDRYGGKLSDNDRECRSGADGKMGGGWVNAVYELTGSDAPTTGSPQNSCWFQQPSQDWVRYDHVNQTTCNTMNTNCSNNNPPKSKCHATWKSNTSKPTSPVVRYRTCYDDTGYYTDEQCAARAPNEQKKCHWRYKGSGGKWNGFTTADQQACEKPGWCSDYDMLWIEPSKAIPSQGPSC